MKTMKYLCPYCGKKAVFGRHFCSETGERDPDADLREEAGDLAPDPSAERKAELRGRLRYFTGSVVIVLFLIAFTRELFGYFSLLLLLLPPLIFLAEKPVRRTGMRRNRTYRQLVVLTGGDRSIADNLVKAELRKNPGLSWNEGVSRAFSKLLYDRNR